MVLPMSLRKEEVYNLLASNQIIIIHGETGCGKSVLTPEYVWDECGGKVVLLTEEFRKFFGICAPNSKEM